jgi:hypothetical protein
MIDEDLFVRGHIDVRIDSLFGDYDQIIDEYFFTKIKNLVGEVDDSDGSEYEVLNLHGDAFEIKFDLASREFVCEDGKTAGFDNLIVKCTGTVEQKDDYDTLDIKTFEVLQLDGYYCD